MYVSNTKYNKPIYGILMLVLIASLLGSCGKSHQLGMDQQPNYTNDSIKKLHRYTQSGTEAAAPAAGKKVTLFMGNTGVGKSTALNALLGCRMQRVKSNEVYGTKSTKRVIIVHPESTKREIMNIGHGGISRTFLPQIAEVPGHPNSAYCDCPGFFDNRGPEISIANAINNRKLLQQASGVNVVLLTNYNGLYNDRGASVTSLAKMCKEMFGSIKNLKMYKNSVLLGITHAPYKDGYGEPITLEYIKNELSEAMEGMQEETSEKIKDIFTDYDRLLLIDDPLKEIKDIFTDYNRLLLIDPLNEGGGDFLPIRDCRSKIASLETIPQEEAVDIFQTALNDRDRRYLVCTSRNLISKMVNAISNNNMSSLSEHWQLSRQLNIIEHEERERIQQEMVAVINAKILEMVIDFTNRIAICKFEDAKSRLEQIKAIIHHLPHAPIKNEAHPDRLTDLLNKGIQMQNDTKALQELVRSNQEEVQKAQKEVERMRTEYGTQLAAANRRMEQLSNALEEAKRTKITLDLNGAATLIGAVGGFFLGGPAGAIVGANIGKAVDGVLTQGEYTTNHLYGIE